MPVELLEQKLEPLPYHVELRDYLKLRERELWNWFASVRAQADFDSSSAAKNAWLTKGL